MRRSAWRSGMWACAIVVLLSAGGAWAVTIHDVQIDQSLYGTVNQDNVLLPPGGGGQNSCSPTAVINSFIYLQNRYPDIYDTKLVPGRPEDAAEDLGTNYMGSTSTGGTSGTGWIDGKIRYMREKVPRSTLFAGQASPGYYTGTNPVVANVNPTIDFLLRELQHGEDVEIGIVPNAAGIGHALTLTSLHWEDNNDNGAFDAGDTATMDGIDPAGGVPFVRTLFPGGPIGTNYYNNGAAFDSTLVLAISESPVPEPVTLAGAGLAIGSLIAYLRRRRGGASQAPPRRA